MRLRAAIGRPAAAVPLHEPELGEHEWAAVRACLGAGEVSTFGPTVGRFEEALAAVTGARFVVATVNGTAALHVALHLAGVTAGDEVIVPSLAFVAIPNAARYCGAIPHFADSDERTLGIDASKLSAYLTNIVRRDGGAAINRLTRRRIAAIVPLHAFGHPADLAHLLEIGDRFGVPIVEDAAQALGSLYDGRQAGTFGRAGILSFNGNKIVTCGGGGAVLTNDPAIAAAARHVTTTAKIAHPWEMSHDRLGFNYRLPSLNAALGCAQLDRLPDFLARKRRLASRYAEAFDGLPGARIFAAQDRARSNHWLNVLVLDETAAADRDAIFAAAHREGYMARAAWTPLHELPMFADCPRMDVSSAESLARRLVALPSSPALADASTSCAS